MELTFKNWLEDMEPTISTDQNDIEKDPTLAPAVRTAQVAMQDAIKKGKNPIKAVQDSLSKSKVPMNKLGQVMPQVNPAKN